MNQKQKIKNSLFVFGVFVVLAGVLFLAHLRAKRIRSLPQNYTVGEVVGFNRLRKQVRKVVYEYSVNDEIIRESTRISNFRTVPKIGDRFMVEFPEKYNGKYGKILIDFPILEDINPPSNGWDELRK